MRNKEGFADFLSPAPRYGAQELWCIAAKRGIFQLPDLPSAIA
jgi:hypothetical protein